MRLTHDWTSTEDQAALEEHTGYAWSVATFTDEFSLRRVQLAWTTTSATGIDEDVRVCTFHHIKLASGAPVDTWVSGDFDTLLGLYGTWWGAIKEWFPASLILSSFKCYREGPAIEPPQPPVYEADLAVAGTNSFGSLPPQVALSVTEKAGTKPHWGRFYLPAPAMTASPDAVMSPLGRPSIAFITDVASSSDTLYQAALTANLPFVVYRRPLPERVIKSGATLAARAASAWTVSQLQVDDVFDVIRSRRFDGPQLRVQRDIT